MNVQRTDYDAIARATVMADRAAGDGADPPPSRSHIAAVAERIRQDEIERQERDARESLII